MPRIVCEPCVDCRFTDCVTVCPSDSFHTGVTMVYINPTTCIDCDACVPECPVEAIYEESEVPEEWKSFISVNAEGSDKNAIITKSAKPLPTAEAKKEKIDASKDPDADKKKKEAADAKKLAERAAFWAVKRKKYRNYLRAMRSRRDADLNDMEIKTERERRYGRVYEIHSGQGGLRIEMEMPRRIPPHWVKDSLNISDEMPHYEHSVSLLSPTRLVVEGKIPDESLRPLIGVIGAFPPQFRREIDLPRPAHSVSKQYRAEDRTLILDLTE